MAAVRLSKRRYCEKIAKIKQQEGPDLHVYGGSNLLQTLLKHDLVDAFWLKIFPITLGRGKRLFADGTIPALFSASPTAPNSESSNASSSLCRTECSN
jgi:dihydrofolate reductase